MFACGGQSLAKHGGQNTDGRSRCKRKLVKAGNDVPMLYQPLFGCWLPGSHSKQANSRSSKFGRNENVRGRCYAPPTSHQQCRGSMKIVATLSCVHPRSGQPTVSASQPSLKIIIYSKPALSTSSGTLQNIKNHMTTVVELYGYQVLPVRLFNATSSSCRNMAL